MEGVVITGAGIISAIGNNLAENRKSLLNAKSGIGKAKFLNSTYKNSLYFGEVPLSNVDLLALLRNGEEGLSRTDILAFKAFEEAIDDAQLKQKELTSMDTAFISASTVGGMSDSDQLFEDASEESNSSPYLDSYSCNSHVLRIVKFFGLKGYTDAINTACSSSANAIMLGAKLIESGRIKRAIVGGTDALSKFTVNGFNALQILSPEKCKPFDQNRSGLNLGEGAAYLVLERQDEAEDKKVYASLSGYGNSNDAFHPSSLSDDAIGVIAAMKEALLTANLNQVDYINTHGTATENNDSVELYGMNKLFNNIPHYNSTKSYTGHTLGAAGAIEAVISLLSLTNNELYPSLNIDQPIDGYSEPIQTLMQDIELKHVLSNSFGFAGNCSSLLFSKKE